MVGGGAGFEATLGGSAHGSTGARTALSATGGKPGPGPGTRGLALRAFEEARVAWVLERAAAAGGRRRSGL